MRDRYGILNVGCNRAHLISLLALTSTFPAFLDACPTFHLPALAHLFESRRGNPSLSIAVVWSHSTSPVLSPLLSHHVAQYCGTGERSAGYHQPAPQAPPIPTIRTPQTSPLNQTPSLPHPLPPEPPTPHPTDLTHPRTTAAAQTPRSHGRPCQGWDGCGACACVVDGAGYGGAVAVAF